MERFDTVAVGRLKPAEYDAFVRDTVNFLDYASDPSQVERRSIGLWVVLFLLVFTALPGSSKKNIGRTSTDASCAVMTLFSAPDEARQPPGPVSYWRKRTSRSRS